MNALIIAAHGSRKPASNDEVARLTEKIRKNAAGQFEFVAHAFLQFAEPLLEQVIEQMAQKKVTTLVIFPFFIGSGAHITSDIPELVAAARQNHPEITIRTTRHLGKIKAIETVILQEILSEIKDT